MILFDLLKEDVSAVVMQSPNFFVLLKTPTLLEKESTTSRF